MAIKTSNTHPLYHWLCNAAENGRLDSSVSWNFQKYLLDENGQLLAVFPPTCDPFDPTLLDYLEN